MEYFPECSSFYISQLVVVHCDNHFSQGSRGDTENYHLLNLFSISQKLLEFTIKHWSIENIRKCMYIHIYVLYITYFIIYAYIHMYVYLVQKLT